MDNFLYNVDNLEYSLLSLGDRLDSTTTNVEAYKEAIKYLISLARQTPAPESGDQLARDQASVLIGALMRAKAAIEYLMETDLLPLLANSWSKPPKEEP